MKGIDRLVDFVYGNHPKRAQIKLMGKDLIQKLREGPIEIREVCKQIGLDYERPADRKKFYVITKPLREVGALHTTKKLENTGLVARDKMDERSRVDEEKSVKK